jgi:DNA-binding NarL/FixJ family response regulator
LKALIADCSTLVRERLAERLAGVESVQVSGVVESAAQVLAAIEDLAPDVLILDSRLPGCNCLDLVRIVRAMPSAPRIVVLATFAYPQFRDRCLQAGAYAFFDKTGDLDQVSAALCEMKFILSEIEDR